MYNYNEAIKNDIKDYIKNEGIKVSKENRNELQESLYDTLFVADSVTGNASGSYTFNRYEAEEYVKENLKECIEALEEFGVSAEEFGRKIAEDEWEYLDVTIRCYLLGEALDEVLDELQEISETLQGCTEAEKVVRQKLTEWHRDNFSDSDWTDIFDKGTTAEIIDALYDSYCDDAFWMIAKVTLSEIRNYYREAYNDNDDFNIRFGGIADSYFYLERFDLIK